MSSLLMTGILFVFAGCAATITRRRFEEQLPFAAGLMILVLYAFALFGRLQLGAYAVLALAAAALVTLGVWLIGKRTHKPWKYLITPGCLAYFLIALWLFVSYRGYMYTEWDDFSHWGLAVKNMSIFSALPSGVPQATITYTDYPPATTLFAWFWMQLSGGFNEGDTQRALNMLMMCFLLPAMKDQDWKRPSKALCMACVLFLLPMTLDPNVYRTMQVDGMLGCIVLYVLFAGFLGEYDTPVLVNICMALMLLPLVKGTGAAFAALLVILLMADRLVHAGHNRKGVLKLLLLLALPVAVAKLSWDWYLQAHHVGHVWSSSSISLSGIIEMVLGQGPAYHRDAIEKFLTAICTNDWWHPGQPISLSHVMWVVLLALVQSWIVGRCTDTQQRKRFRQGFGLLMAGLLAYAIALLMMYLFLFREDEALRMVSLDRYLSSYMLPMTGITLLAVDKVFGSMKVKGGLHAPLCIMTGLLLAVDPLMIAESTVLAGMQNKIAYEARMDELIPDEVFSQLDSETDRVYIIACNNDGYQYYLGAYQFTPVHVQEGMWTIWPVIQKEDVWYERPALECSPQEWAQTLLDGSFTHVYLDTVDERFINDYASLFETPQAIRSAQLYQVEAHGNGAMLTAVQ